MLKYTSNGLSYLDEVGNNKVFTSNSLTYVFKPEIGQRVKYTANTTSTKLSTANTNMDGTGTTYSLITGATTYGTLIKTITIKGEQSLSRGMVRFFLKTESTYSIVNEIEIPAIQETQDQSTFALSLKVGFRLEASWELVATTQIGNNIIVTVEGLDISYPA